VSKPSVNSKTNEHNSDPLSHALQLALNSSEEAMAPLVRFLSKLGATQIEDLRGLEEDDMNMARIFLPKLKRLAFDDLVDAMAQSQTTATIPTVKAKATLVSQYTAAVGNRSADGQVVIASVVLEDESGPEILGTVATNAIGSSEWRGRRLTGRSGTRSFKRAQGPTRLRSTSARWGS